jgi:Lamin Tail Domain
MKFILSALILLTVTLSLTVESQAAVVITEVMVTSLHPGGASNGDWFEVTNTGSSSVNIGGWSWGVGAEAPGIKLFGPNAGNVISTLAAGESVLIVQETAGAEASWRTSWGISAAVQAKNVGGSVTFFTASGGTLSLYDNTNAAVTSVTFGTATNGRTFSWNTTGQPLGVSSVGVDGSFLAATNGASGAGLDIGSPGLAIPEVTRSLSCALGLLSLLLRRKRSI